MQYDQLGSMWSTTSRPSSHTPPWWMVSHLKQWTKVNLSFLKLFMSGFCLNHTNEKRNWYRKLVPRSGVIAGIILTMWFAGLWNCFWGGTCASLEIQAIEGIKSYKKSLADVLVGVWKTRMPGCMCTVVPGLRGMRILLYAGLEIICITFWQRI